MFANKSLTTSSFPRKHLFGDPKLLVERLGARSPAQKLLQYLHLLLRTTALEHSMPVPPSLLGVHGVIFEDGVEHVGGVHLGGKVAVVAANGQYKYAQVKSCTKCDLPCIVSADQVTKSSLAVAPVPVALLVTAQGLRAVELGDLLA